jgi:RNA polymerase sigma factor (sigma-70 family)
MPKKSVADVFSGYRERLLKFIRSRVRRLEDAEDILQDVFYQYANVNSIINPIENTAAWLYKVARNRIIDHHKKKKDDPLPVHYNEDEDDYIVDEIADIIYGEEASPETEMFRALIIEEMQTVLAELPKEQREVYEMTELLDFSVKEVAEKTKTSVNTVLSRKHYAVRHLRNRLKELYISLLGKSLQ